MSSGVVPEDWRIANIFAPHKGHTKKCAQCAPSLPPPARTSKSAGSPRSARTTIGGDRIKRLTGMCELLRPAHGNEQYHRLVYAWLKHAFKISYFYSS